MECCYKNSNAAKVPTNSLIYGLYSSNKGSVTGGFGSAVATSSALNVKFYNQNGDVLYTVPPIAPRKL